MPQRRRLLWGGLLLLGLTVLGWLLFAYGAAGLVLRAGDCAGRAPMDLLLLGWLVVVVAAGAAPPALLLMRGRWRPVLRALGIGFAGVAVFYVATFGILAATCG